MSQKVPPGWHPDPHGAGCLRWWDGSQWTAHTAPLAGPPASVPETPPLPTPPAQAPAEPTPTGPANADQPPTPPPPPFRPPAAPSPEHHDVPAELELEPEPEPASNGVRPPPPPFQGSVDSPTAAPPLPPPPDQAPAPAPTGSASTPNGEVYVPAAVAQKPKGGLLAGKKALEQENAELRQAFEAIGATERERLKVEIVATRADYERAVAETEKRKRKLEKEFAKFRAEQERQRADLAAQLAGLKALVADTSEMAVLQEVGIYEYQHPLDSSVAYKAELARLKDEMKSLTRNKEAVHAATDWQVGGSVTEGRKMVTEFSKLMLRAYNTEVDTLVRAMKPYKLQSAIDRLNKSRQTISKLGRTMHIEVTEQYHRLRVRELELTADYLAKVAEEKESQRAERARLREEEKAQAELRRERERLEKEQGHYESALEALRAKGDLDGLAELEAKLAEIRNAIEGVDYRAANTRAGYVYVISNFGAFGERMVKIGMTRRLEPMDRVRELGDASVPFRYDVHALIFSEDAVGLEGALHNHFADRRVNLVNQRREFFYVTPAEVRDALATYEANLLTFDEEPEALEWHQSENMRRPGAATNSS
ncbi:MAG: DUF4041 domain-containing protein [Acidimicrobiia bacterium]|nr:DUF4041 domain-containing protein [Acidimicrobiia bacterium]